MTEKLKKFTLQITFDLEDAKGGIGNFIGTLVGIAKPTLLETRDDMIQYY